MARHHPLAFAEFLVSVEVNEAPECQWDPIYWIDSRIIIDGLLAQLGVSLNDLAAAAPPLQRVPMVTLPFTKLQVPSDPRDYSSAWPAWPDPKKPDRTRSILQLALFGGRYSVAAWHVRRKPTERVRPRLSMHAIARVIGCSSATVSKTIQKLKTAAKSVSSRRRTQSKAYELTLLWNDGFRKRG
jgi:hypothetical protein